MFLDQFVSPRASNWHTKEPIEDQVLTRVPGLVMGTYLGNPTMRLEGLYRLIYETSCKDAPLFLDSYGVVTNFVMGDHLFVPVLVALIPPPILASLLQAL